MDFAVYSIKSPKLRPYLPYILFNYSEEDEFETTVVSYPNTNVCLGVIKGKRLVETNGGFRAVDTGTDLSSYISGLYTTPHSFYNRGSLDEVCLDFTPIGFSAMSKCFGQAYVLDQDPLQKLLGPKARDLFRKVFDIPDIGVRGGLIENFLLDHFRPQIDPRHAKTIHELKNDSKPSCLKRLSRAARDEFQDVFGISPKQYQRIDRFRSALRCISSTDRLTDIAYLAGYYDQSHMIKEFSRLGGMTPKQLRRTLTTINDQVLVGVA